MWRLISATVLVLGLSSQAALALDLPWRRAEAVADAPPRPVVSLVVHDGMTDDLSIPGIIAARVEVALGFQTLGRVTARHVDTGDIVQQNDLLASLNPDDLQSQVRAAEVAAESAEVELRTARAAAERARALARRNVTSAAQLEQAESALATALANRQQTQSELLRARDAEGFAEMRAPFAGVISAVFANPGAVVTAGEPVVRLSAGDDIEAVIDLPDLSLSRVKVGDPYEVWSESDPDRILPATVAQIEPVADAVTRTRRVHLALGEDADLRLGGLVRARPAGRAAVRMVLPQAAILNRDGTDHVWVITRDGDTGTVALREITTQGPVVDDMVAIASGLSPGDEVAIRGIHSLTAGQTVGDSVAP